MRARRTHGLAAGAVVLAVLVGAPAIGVGSSDPGVQPPPGTVDTSPEAAAPVPAQPPAHAKPVKVTKVAPVPRQPVNRNPHRGPSKPTTVVDRSDRGAKNVRATKDRGRKNVPTTRDRGDR